MQTPPSGLITKTSTTSWPAPGGVATRICDELCGITFGLSSVPNQTSGGGVTEKPEPEMITPCPPPPGPVVFDRDEILHPAYVKASTFEQQTPFG